MDTFICPHCRKELDLGLIFPDESNFFVHNCAVKITTWVVSPVCRMLSEYIFPNESFEVVCERFKYLMG